MTYEEQVAAAEELFQKVAEIIKQYKSEDMIAEKVADRIAVVGALGGATRTTAMAAVAFGAVYGCLTGLTKSQLLGLFEALFEAVEANPTTLEAKQSYAESNAKYKAQAAASSQMASEHGFDAEGVILAPMPKLKQ